jgi:putative sigma-54 modulation protein
MVTGRHIHVTDGMKQHAIDKISKLDKIGDRIIDVHVTMDIQKLSHRCDIMMKYGQTFIRSHADTTDMYVSIDQAVSKLNRQLRRYRHRLKQHHAKKYEMEEEELPVTVYSIAEFLAEEEEEEEFIEVPHKVVASEARKLKLLNEDEAIMKMELSQDRFMVYRSEEDRQIKIIYRREDENYGIINLEP